MLNSVVSVVKERELDFEIGYPTDVKHVAHIGADGIGGAPPTWVCNGYTMLMHMMFCFFYVNLFFWHCWFFVFQMNEFKAGPDFSAPTLGSFKEKKSLNSKGMSAKTLECKILLVAWDSDLFYK